MMAVSKVLTPAGQIKAAILTLKDSGDDGFEGLMAALLGAVTHLPFRLERFSAELNHQGFTGALFSDSRSVLAKEAGTNGSSFIA